MSDRERLTREAEVLRQEIRWHEEREPTGHTHIAAWAAAIVGLRQRLRETEAAISLLP